MEGDGNSKQKRQNIILAEDSDAEDRISSTKSSGDNDVPDIDINTKGKEIVIYEPKNKHVQVCSRYEPVPDEELPPLVRGENWSEKETFKLLQAWGERLERNGRKNLRHGELSEVAEKVFEGKRTRTQCRNRLDHLKKVYKKFKAELAEGSGSASRFVYFDELDKLLNPTSDQEIGNPWDDLSKKRIKIIKDLELARKDILEKGIAEIAKIWNV